MSVQYLSGYAKKPPKYYNVITEVELYNDLAAEFKDIKVEKLATGFQFAEGPVWHPDNYLLFSDVIASQIIQLFPDGKHTIYLADSGGPALHKHALSKMIGSNGLAIKDTNIIFCQGASHSIACLNREMEISVLVDNYQGKPLNSPNDLILKTDGSFYFSDPPYGLKDEKENPEMFQDKAGVYYFSEGKLKRIFEELNYPNGVCLSPDEQFLYISSNHPQEPYLYKCLLSVTGEITEKTILREENADGIATDLDGNLFLSTNEGVLIISEEGQKLALLPLPEPVHNIAWGGSNLNELYITAGGSVYKAKNFI